MINLRSIATLGIGFTKKAIAAIGLIIDEIVSSGGNPTGVIFDNLDQYKINFDIASILSIKFDDISINTDLVIYNDNLYCIFDNQIFYNIIIDNEIQYFVLFDSQPITNTNDINISDNILSVLFDNEVTYKLTFDKELNYNIILD